MAQSSTKDRRIRLLKRQRNQAWKELDLTWRYVKEVLFNHNAIQAELKKYTTKYGTLQDEPVVKKTKSVADQLTFTEETVTGGQAGTVTGVPMEHEATIGYMDAVVQPEEASSE